VQPVAGTDQNVKVLEYRGTPQTVIEMVKAANGERGQKSFKLRDRVERVIRNLNPKDYWSEALAIYYWTCGPLFRYTRDPLRVEQVKDPLRILWEIDKKGVTLVDCDDFATFILACLGTIGARGRIVTVGFQPANGRSGNPKIMEEPELRFMSGENMRRLPGPFTHVFCQALKPGGSWVTLDPVAGPRTANMHRRVKQMRIYVPD
jgi:hypothetical protein